MTRLWLFRFSRFSTLTTSLDIDSDVQPHELPCRPRLGSSEGYRDARCVRGGCCHRITGLVHGRAQDEIARGMRRVKRHFRRVPGSAEPEVVDPCQGITQPSRRRSIPSEAPDEPHSRFHAMQGPTATWQIHLVTEESRSESVLCKGEPRFEGCLG